MICGTSKIRLLGRITSINPLISANANTKPRFVKIVLVAGLNIVILSNQTIFLKPSTNAF